MHRRMHDCNQKDQKRMFLSSTTLDWGMPQVRPFITQLKMQSQSQGLKASLSQAERYGHHLEKIQPAEVYSGIPIQMVSATEEEEKKRMLGMDLEVSKLTGNKDGPDKVLPIKFNNNHKRDINSDKSVDEVTSVTETSKSRHKGKDKNYDEHLTLVTKHKDSENKAVEDTSLPQDPEVKRLLDKESKNNLPGLGGNTQEQNQDKNFVAPPSIYDEDKNTTTPKAGTRGQFLAKKEAMDILGDRKAFTVTQRAVKKLSIGDGAEVKAKDNQHQVKLKNAAELVRNQVIKDDRQVKENLRGNFNLEPDIVAKQGGEQLILHKMQ